jgi:hypothetical protein
MPRLAALLLPIALLTGCAAPGRTPYQRLQANGGYNEQQIEANRYRVSFIGNAVTTREDVEDALLYRIAELTLAQGCDYFVLSDRDTEASTAYLQTLSSYGSFDPFFPRVWPRATMSTGTAMPITQYKAQAYVLLQKGVKPEGDVAAFDAREVQARLGPSVRAPAAAR